MKICTPEDKETVLDLVRERASEIFEDFMDSSREEKIILLEDGGLFVGMSFNTSQYKLATDVLWFVSPELRNQGIGSTLLDAFEYWARKTRCDLIMITSLNPSGNNEYFEERGYELKELAYVKQLTYDPEN